MFGPLLEAVMSKKCTQLWREAHFEVKSVHQSCSEVRALISWEGLRFGASDLQFWEDDFAWQVQHFVWPGLTFSWQAQYFRQVEWKNRKTHWYEAVSFALNFPFLKDVSQNCFSRAQQARRFLCGRHPQNIGHFFIRMQRWQVWVAMRRYARRRKRLCWDHFAWHVCRASVASASIAGSRNLWILCAKGAANRIGTETFTVASDVGFWVSLCRVAGFETACATFSSLCVVSLSLWRAANYDIARATLLSLCACWIALAVVWSCADLCWLSEVLLRRSCIGV